MDNYEADDILGLAGRGSREDALQQLSAHAISTAGNNANSLVNPEAAEAHLSDGLALTDDTGGPPDSASGVHISTPAGDGIQSQSLSPMAWRSPCGTSPSSAL